jgi:type I restriction enzyme, S subunit
MRSDWTQITLGELASQGHAEIKTGPFGTKLKANEYASEGTPLISVREIQLGRVEVAPHTPRVPPNIQARMPEYLLQLGDIVFARKGGIERSAFISEEQVGFFMGSDALRVRFDDTICSLFVSYVVRSRQIQAWLLQHSTGSTMASLSGRVLALLPLFLPPLAEQKRIAALLGSLDDLIELNREMNQILEEMAQAIFKSWFIDFDGVPEEDLVESELGLIPRGWEVKTINDVVKIVGGSTPSTKVNAYWEGGEIYWTTPKDLSSLSVPVLSDTARKITSQGLEKISSGLLPEGTLLMSSRAPVGYLAINTIPVAINQGYIAMLSGGEVSPLWLLYWSHANMDHIKSRAGGSTFAEISKRNFRTINVLKPPQALLDEFETQVSGLRSIVVNNTQQSQILSELRDTLLPKLISGELRIPEAEKMVEDVL